MPAEGSRYLLVPIDQITVRKRHRRQSDYSDLKASIERRGLLHPITLSRDLVLGAGMHRILACRDLGWNSIPAFIEPYDEVELELAELEENLARHPLTTLEQGEHLVRRSELLRQLGLRAQAGRPRNTDETSVIPLTTADLAAAAGLHERVARRRMEIANGLSQDERDAIRDTAIADSLTDLLTLCRLSPEDRTAVIAAICRGARSVSEARRSLNGAAHDEDEAASDDDHGVAEHMHTVMTTTTFRYRARNPQMRQRADRTYERERRLAGEGGVEDWREPSFAVQGVLTDAGIEIMCREQAKRYRAGLLAAQAAAGAPHA